MATSGSATFNPSLDVIIEEAFERAGTELRSGYDLKSARRSLDIMAAEWSNRGLNLWTVTVGTQALTAGTASYTLPTDTIDLLEHVIRSGSGTSQADYDIERIGVSSYAAIVNKNQTGRPVQIYVERTLTPTVNVWPVPDVNTYTLVYWRMRRIQDTGAATNTADIPSRFIPALVSGLAYYIALKRPALMNRVQMLKQIYDEQFQMAYEEDRERVPLRIIPYTG
jgi:hypothetical protein